jgi:phosphotriesterase-related protein
MAMSKSDLAGKAQTVLGLISPQSLGITLTHEHLFVDLSIGLRRMGNEPSEATVRELFYQKVTPENRWWINYHPTTNLDNLVLQNEEIATREALFYRHAGGGSLVDASNSCMARDALALARVSRATGLNIIMGSGYYVPSTYPTDMDSKTEEEICEEIVCDVTVGVGDTGIRAGIIGEIGCDWPLSDNERKVLRAAAKAQQVTGAPLSVHPGRDAKAPLEIVEILIKSGADIRRTVICHIDRTLTRAEDRRKLAETGCYLEYDLFGQEGYYFVPTIDLPNDHQRINEVTQLIELGHLHQTLLSQDICMKYRLRRYGGHGYDHILRNVVPIMRTKGMSEEEIHTLLIENPACLLQFARI